MPRGEPRRIAELLGADLLHVIDPGELRAVVIAQAARLVVDDVTQGGQAIGDRQDLVDLLLVLDDRDRDLGVLEHVGHLVGNRVRVDRHRHRAERLPGAHRPVEPRAVRPDDGELVAALQPKLRKAGREGAHPLEHLAPRPGLPDAKVLVPHRNAATARFRVVNQELGKCICFGAVSCHDAVPSEKAHGLKPHRRCPTRRRYPAVIPCGI